jgi:hypothetical protein
MAILNHDGLRRFMTDAECGRDGIGYDAIFDDPDYAADHILRFGREAQELIVGCVAYRTLRAMLENEDGTRLRGLQESIQVLASL